MAERVLELRDVGFRALLAPPPRSAGQPLDGLSIPPNFYFAICHVGIKMKLIHRIVIGASTTMFVERHPSYIVKSVYYGC